MGAFSSQRKVSRPQTDEGRPCHCHPVTGCQGTFSPREEAFSAKYK